MNGCKRCLHLLQNGILLAVFVKRRTYTADTCTVYKAALGQVDCHSSPNVISRSPMGTTSPVVATAATLRTRQYLKVDFFRVMPTAGGPSHFQASLRELLRRRGKNRIVQIRQGRVDLHACKETGSLIQGEFGRVRMYDIPSIAKADSSISEITLAPEEGVTERTAFLFDVTTGVLAIHSRREAASASQIAAVCDAIGQNKEQFFELALILNPQAQARYNRMDQIHSVSVSYTAEAENTIKRPDSTTQEFLRGLSQAGGSQIDITISVPASKGTRLNFDIIRNLVNKANTAKQEGVNQLKISGRANGDERLAVDLIKDRLRAVVPVVVLGSSASYEQRSLAVLQSYQANKALIG